MRSIPIATIVLVALAALCATADDAKAPAGSIGQATSPQRQPQPDANASQAAKASSDAAVRWQALPDMPMGVLAADISVVGDVAVITGGINQGGFATDRVQRFDLKKKRWLKPLKMKTGRCMHAQVTLPDGRLLVAGGQTGRVKPIGAGLKGTATCEVIDLKTGQVSRAPDLPRAVLEPTGHLLPDGRAIIIGGRSAMVFDPKLVAWGRAIGLRDTRQAHASTMLPDGRVVVIGGIGKRSIEVINPRVGVSKLLTVKLPMGMDDMSAVTIDAGRVWILGGQDSKSGWTTDRTWVLHLDDKTAKLIDGPSLLNKDGIADACTVRVGHYVILAGGESEFAGRDTELTTARLLDLRELKVIVLPDMAEKHDDSVAVATGRGMIIFGGFKEVGIDVPVLGQQATKPKLRIPTAVSKVEQIDLPQQIVGAP